ncbi:MAG: GNAT family N-acetyltransferase [Oscillospiraceae bacterium]|nr:GNAT family N-acetyltransferase [Oscillospiraceae bacterium]
MDNESCCFRVEQEDLELLKLLFPDDFDKRLRQLREGTIDIFAVSAAGRPVGRIVANYTNQHLDTETLPKVRACLSHFFLWKEFRGRGLGSCLLAFALNELSARGYREFTVGVEEKNSVAKHLYFQNGFLEKIDRGYTPCEYDLYLKR